jgi:glycosyltransferase involved in cell wall biosynthesis
VTRTGRLEGLRVVIVLKWAGLGGAERQALLLARHLVEVEGAVVEVRALNDADGRARELFRKAGIPWVARRGRWRGSLPRTFARLARAAVFLRDARPDVLLPYCDVPNVVCGLVWRSAGARTCVWNQRDRLPFTLGDRLAGRAARGTPVIVSNSEHGAEFVAAHGAPRERIRVIPNGVHLPPPAASREEWRRVLGVEESDLVVSSLSHFYAHKDHETLLAGWQRALARADGNRPSFTLVLAGRPEGRRAVLDVLARDLGVVDRVRFVGDVDDVAGLLEASDLSVLSSPAEGCSNAVLESMAAGLPVVGTDVPGIRDALGEDQGEFLVPVGDADALAAALSRLCEDGALRRAVGQRNAERQRAIYGSERMLDETVTAIVDGLEASRTSRPARRR